MGDDKVNQHCKRILLNGSKDGVFASGQTGHYVSVFLFTSFFNNVVGISDPDRLNPPDYCLDGERTADEEGQTDFLSLFLKKH